MNTQVWEGRLEKLDDYRWRIPETGGMRVPGLVFADDPGLMLEGEVRWVRPVPQRFGAILYEGGVEFTDVNLLRFQQFCERLGLQHELAQTPTERSARR